MVRVLIVDDSLVARTHLMQLLRSDGAIAVAGEAVNGAEAIEFVQREKVDVVLMDMYMPTVDGYEATRTIMERTPLPIIILTSSWDPQDVDNTFRALEAGAVAVLAKPRSLAHPDGKDQAAKVIETVKLMSEVRVIKRWPKRLIPSAPLGNFQAGPASGRAGVEVVAVGASTGGPPALRAILSGLPADCRTPVLIVQHIAKGFLPGLVRWLGGATPLPVRIPGEGDRMELGHIYLAPDGVHMGVTRAGIIVLSGAPPEYGSRPAVAHLFRSVAQEFGRNSAAVLLTGMGRDGAAELAAIKRAGGVTFAQDKFSSVVHGMPGEAISLGAVGYVLTPPEIAKALASLVATGGAA